MPLFSTCTRIDSTCNDALYRYTKNGLYLLVSVVDSYIMHRTYHIVIVDASRCNVRKVENKIHVLE